MEHTCPQCKKVFNARREQVYCSRSCGSKVTNTFSKIDQPWNKGLKGIAANRPRTGEERNCQKCGKAFYKAKYRDVGVYCSVKCYLSTRWEGHAETRSCKICNAEFSVPASSTNVTCSRKCGNKHKRLTHLGEKSHLWRGGKTKPYNKEWRIYRAEALERDGFKCAICGSEKNISVHHINPYRYSHSHDLDNLITLCRPCHSKEELKVNDAQRQGLRQRWPKKDQAADS